MAATSKQNWRSRPFETMVVLGESHVAGGCTMLELADARAEVARTLEERRKRANGW